MRLGRLHHRIYLSLLVVALLSTAGAGFVAHVLLDRRFESPFANRLQAEAEYVARALPPPEAPPGRLSAVLRDLGDGLRLDLVVLDAHGAPLASNVEPPPRMRQPLKLAAHRPVWMLTSHGHAMAVRLESGGVLAVWPRGIAHALLPPLALFFGLLALGCLPIARGLSRRLEALEQGVARLGSGQLGTRVAVQGGDEIARLAERFNWSAERIERLVEAQRRVLLSASHELRSPLARLRLALELIRDSAGPGLEPRVAAAVAEVGELDALVGDVLLASRIEAQDQLAVSDPVDLAALLVEEGARVGAALELEPVTLSGDARLLRRLVRNLLDNAVRYGCGGEISAGVSPVAAGRGGVRLWVADRGAGVAPEEQERIFEPFYRGSRTPSDAAGAGVGLGLALVRQIAEHHGGRAECRAREGGGTLFEVTLPAG